MNAARRLARRRDWPRGLYEKRPGYYTWRNWKTGKELTLGRVPFAHARNEALRANKHLAALGMPDLVAMITGAVGHTMAELVADMPVAEKRSTRNTFRANDKIITEGALVSKTRVNGLGKILCAELTVKHCADLLDIMVKASRGHQAAAVRSRLAAVCVHGIRKGWLQTNPAEVTAKPKTPVGRGRLSLEQFIAIRDAGAAQWPWLPHAMNLALLTGQDRSTIAAAMRRHVVDQHLICHRSKTADKVRPLAIPLAIRLDALGMSLGELLAECTSVGSKFFIHHRERQGQAAPGDAVGVNTITEKFTEARKLANIPDEVDGKGAPTFHEIRSLAKRLYDAQGNVDTKLLLGHQTEAMARLYKDTRDGAPIRVVVNSK